MRAAKTDANQSRIVDALRAEGFLVLLLHRVGEGVPDLLVGSGGVLGLIEVKDGQKPPSARGLTDAQIRFWAEWNGYPMTIAETEEDALRFCRMLGKLPSDKID